jgi:hypothetical protein
VFGEERIEPLSRRSSGTVKEKWNGRWRQSSSLPMFQAATALAYARGFCRGLLFTWSDDGVCRQVIVNEFVGVGFN